MHVIYITLIVILLLTLTITAIVVVNLTKDEMVYDNVIVGGGISGAYLAYNLTKMGKKVLLLESSTEVGGRLMSYPIDPPTVPFVLDPSPPYCVGATSPTQSAIELEYGGMRFFPEHTVIKKLVCDVFKDKLVPQNVPYYTSQGTVYLRGDQVIASDVASTITTRYNIIGNNNVSVLNQSNDKMGNPFTPFTYFTEQIRDPVFNRVWNNYYPGVTPPMLDNFATLDSDTKSKVELIMTSDPVFVNNSAEDFINRELMQIVKANGTPITGSITEYVDAYKDSQGYTLFTLLPAGITILEDVDVLASDGQYFLQGGYKKLVEALIDGCNQNLLTTEFNSPVTNVQNKSSDGNFKIEKNGKNVLTKNLFNTIPPNKCMDWSINTKYASYFNNVHPIITMKIFIQFKDIWWNPISQSGKHITTLPFRQVWMYNKDPPIVLIYCDLDDAKFFRNMVTQDSQLELIEPNTTTMGDLVENVESLFVQMFGELNNEVQKFGTTQPNDDIPVYKQNNIEKLGWAYLDPCCYFWNVKADIQGTMNTISNPEPGYYVSGDSWSIRQGWVEGALESSDCVLEKM